MYLIWLSVIILGATIFFRQSPIHGSYLSEHHDNPQTHSPNQRLL
jgi:hypothetical protein